MTSTVVELDERGVGRIDYDRPVERTPRVFTNNSPAGRIVTPRHVDADGFEVVVMDWDGCSCLRPAAGRVEVSWVAVHAPFETREAS